MRCSLAVLTVLTGLALVALTVAPVAAQPVTGQEPGIVAIGFGSVSTPAATATLQFLLGSSQNEAVATIFGDALRQLGIQARVKLVDQAQYNERRNAYDYDMIENRWDQSLSPVNEQAVYWGSAAADTDGTRNYMGVRSGAIDAVIAALLQARGREEFVSTVRTLDRILISGFYVVPLFHLPEQWIARSNAIEHPATTPLFGYLPETWWRAQ